MMLAASHDHIHGGGVGIGGGEEVGGGGNEEEYRTPGAHMEDKEKQGVLMTLIMCALGC